MVIKLLCDAAQLEYRALQRALVIMGGDNSTFRKMSLYMRELFIFFITSLVKLYFSMGHCSNAGYILSLLIAVATAWKYCFDILCFIAQGFRSLIYEIIVNLCPDIQFCPIKEIHGVLSIGRNSLLYISVKKYKTPKCPYLWSKRTCDFKLLICLSVDFHYAYSKDLNKVPILYSYPAIDPNKVIQVGQHDIWVKGERNFKISRK